MQRMTHRFGILSFKRDVRGAAALEFALVVPLFFFILFATFEYGLIMFSQIAMESATNQVAQSTAACVGTAGCDAVTLTRNLIQEKTSGLLNGDQVVIVANKVADGGAPPEPDVCNINGHYSTPANCPVVPEPDAVPGTRVIDRNGNGVYDAPGSLSVGASGDLIEIRASYPWQIQFPFMRDLFGPDGVVMITATTVVKNQ